MEQQPNETPEITLEEEAIPASANATPGMLLKQARESQYRTQEEIAAKLRLSVQTIKDIENDDYTHISAIVYIRGYLRSIAELLRIDEAAVMAAFEGLGVTKEPMSTTLLDVQSLPIYKRSKIRFRFGGSRAMARWVGISVLTLLIILVFMWWRGEVKSAYTNPSASLSTNDGGAIALTVSNAVANPTPPPVVVAKTPVKKQANAKPVTQAAKKVKSAVKSASLKPNYTVTSVNN